MKVQIAGFVCLILIMLGFNLLLHRLNYDRFSRNLPALIERHLSGTTSSTSSHSNRSGNCTSQPTSSTRSPPAPCSRYVIFSNGFPDGRRLGNQIFNYVAGIYVSELTGRRLAMNDSGKALSYLEEAFRMYFERNTVPCPIHDFYDELNLSYNKKIESLFDNSQSINKTINLHGFFQSWKYTRFEDLVRSQLQFKDDIKVFAKNFLRTSIPPGWKHGMFTRVGIHARRGDLMNESKVKFGYTTPNVTYFKKAMQHFKEAYGRVQYLVLSDDPQWTEKNIIPDLIESKNESSAAHVTIVNAKHSPGQDLAILSMCDHNIISTGSFGWWGAWLGKGSTIYYSNWPRNGSDLSKGFKREDYFPPSWMGMDDWWDIFGHDNEH